jgi:hypothetical protein
MATGGETVMEELGKTDDPCAAEDKAYGEAMREWLRLEDRVRDFVNTKPLQFGQQVTPIPFEDLAKAQSAAAEAKRVYQERERAFFECRRRHGGNRGQEA